MCITKQVPTLKMERLDTNVLHLAFGYQNGLSLYERDHKLRYKKCLYQMRNNFYFRSIKTCLTICTRLNDYDHVNYGRTTISKHTKNMFRTLNCKKCQYMSYSDSE